MRQTTTGEFAYKAMRPPFIAGALKGSKRKGRSSGPPYLALVRLVQAVPPRGCYIAQIHLQERHEYRLLSLKAGVFSQHVINTIFIH